jgi:hypothetical protein
LAALDGIEDHQPGDDGGLKGRERQDQSGGGLLQRCGKGLRDQ